MSLNVLAKHISSEQFYKKSRFDTESKTNSKMACRGVKLLKKRWEKFRIIFLNKRDKMGKLCDYKHCFCYSNFQTF